MKLQDIKINAYVEPYIENKDEPFKDTINLDYHLINGTEGVFFNDSLIVLNEIKTSPTVLHNDMGDTACDKKLGSESAQTETRSVEEDRKTHEGVSESTELIADKPIRDYFELDCIECCVKFKTFYEFKSHFKSVHQQKGKVKCCGKSFTRRCEVVDHISLHQNPEKFKYAMPYLTFFNWVKIVFAFL